jgi:hypothetical protein
MAWPSLGYISTARKNGLHAITGTPWLPTTVEMT